MEYTKKVAVLGNETQAQLVGKILAEGGIPHIIRSHRDTVYDGLFQTTLGRGHLEALEKHRKKVLAALKEIGNERANSG